MLQYHAAGFRAAGAEILAICDMNQAAAKKAAEMYNVSNVFSDSAEMLEKLSELDAVSIITPNRTHRPLALQVLQAGRHVFCEKPPALNASEVLQMKEASESAGKTLMFNCFCMERIRGALVPGRQGRQVFHVISILKRIVRCSKHQGFE